MRWESVTSTLGYSVYALWNNGRKLVTLVFNPSSSAARIEYEGERRVFLIRNEGFRKSRTVLRNEYGMHIGHVGSENSEDFIELNNERFFYEVDNSTTPSVKIYKDSKEQPLAVCDWDVKRKDVLGSFRNNRIDENTQYSLLMTLCWYLFQPVQKAKLEKSMELV
jgi:hypothetical protein